MDEDKNITKEVLKLENNEIVALLPVIFDAGFQYSEFLIGQIKEFCASKGYPLGHLDIVFTISYDLNISAINHKMNSTNSLTIYENDEKFTAIFVTNSTLHNS